MNDPVALLALIATLVVALSIAMAAALAGWRGWLELKRLEISQMPGTQPASPSPAARIELADLKERVRKLEAIAAGTEP